MRVARGGGVRGGRDPRHGAPLGRWSGHGVGAALRELGAGGKAATQGRVGARYGCVEPAIEAPEAEALHVAPRGDASKVRRGVGAVFTGAGRRGGRAAHDRPLMRMYANFVHLCHFLRAVGVPRFRWCGRRIDNARSAPITSLRWLHLGIDTPDSRRMRRARSLPRPSEKR